MKVVALVSGGKDSCYAMQRCVDYGHQIVALANLLPADDGVDELDSFMYQTVGHQMICAIAQCMGLPLYRRRIQGTSRLQEMRYKKTKGDEVEDLESLLLAVKQKHPEVQAVSSGAIASNYQRLRIESICSRLGLISLAYMWEQDQAALLQNMIDSGIHAVLVKVAAIGMDPRKHLGKDLASLQPHLTRLASMYGSNVCGEGGEYESLTLDSPLYKRARIHLDEFDIILHSPDQIAPVGVLHPTKFHLEPKDDASSTADLSSDYLVFEVTENAAAIGDSLQNPSPKPSSNDQVQVTLISQRHGFVTVGCWRQHCEKLGVQEELGLLLSTVESSLERQGLSWGNVVYVRLFLEDMASFGLANEVYVKHITEQKCERGVPSRCCMQVCLLEAGMGGALVEVLAASDCEKRVLHVQSISCWAPSCIGPYSQATLHRNILHMAGQLGLDPPTMALVAGGSTLEMQQAMENCEAVAGAFKVGLRGDAIAFNIYCSAALSAEDRAQVERCLHQFLEADSADDDDSDDVRKDPRISNPLILFVLVPALPKGALVEVEPSLFVDSDIDSTWQHLQIESPPTQCCRALVLPQRYARAMTCIRSTSAKEESLTSLSLNKSDGQELEESALQAVTTLKHRIFEAAAKLSWSDITTFRVYYDAKAVAAAPLRAVLAQALEKMKEEGEEVVAPTLIPTCEASSSLLLNRERNLLVLDVTAAAAAAGATHNQP